MKSLSIAPKKNCPPNAKHNAGRIEAGFFSDSGLKFTLADVLRYVALVALELPNKKGQSSNTIFGTAKIKTKL